MDADALDRFLALNRHLEAVAAAGVPLALEGDEAMRRYDARVAIEMGRGQTLAAAVASNPELPPRYRSAVLAYSVSENATAALTALDTDVADDESRSTWSWSAVIPLIVLAVLATLAGVYYAWFVWPAFTSFYRQLAFEPPWVGRVLWLPAGAFMAVTLVLLWRIRRPQRRDRGTLHHERDSTRSARFADLLARLLADGVPPADAIELVGQAVGDKQLGAAAATLGDGVSKWRYSRIQREVRWPRLPPLLRWALIRNCSPDPAPLAAELRFVGDFYRRSAGVCRASLASRGTQPAYRSARWRDRVDLRIARVYAHR